MISEHLKPFHGQTIGVAVSGGGDSMALLHLACEYYGAAQVRAVTVDHGLRKAAADEAMMVGRVCDGLKVCHDILRWTGWSGKGNLQDQARRGRYGLITDWAKTRGIKTVLIGHTQDDQAETFLMRLARGSGVDGLSGMAETRVESGIIWARPMLAISRQELRDYLTAKGATWVDDPTNDDESFDRVKARKILKTLAPLGIDAVRLAKTANGLQLARVALEMQTQEAAKNLTQIIDGNVVVARTGFLALPDEIAARVLAHGLVWISEADYRPRKTALTAALDDIRRDKSTTLHGCKIAVRQNNFVILREYQSIKDLTCGGDQIWDNRWRVIGDDKDVTIRALGPNGLDQCKEWKKTGKRRAELLVSPSVWQEGRLIAAPMAGFGTGWQVKPIKNADDFVSSILSH